MVELNEFIKQTLEQIVAGVRGAQDATRGTGAAISPSGNDVRQHGSPRTPLPQYGPGGGVVEYVSFDLAVTEVGGSEAKGGVGVFFGSVGIGGQAKSESQAGSTNRIKFTIPVVLPPYRKEP